MAQQLQELTLLPSCYKNALQKDINPEFLKILTEKHQQEQFDRKSCHMCVQPLGGGDPKKFKEALTKGNNGLNYPKKERCPNLNDGKYGFTSPKGKKWPGNKIAWAGQDGGHPFIQMTNINGKWISEQYKINKVYKDPCGVQIYDKALGVCWYAWHPDKTIQANKKKDLSIVHGVNTNSVHKKKDLSIAHGVNTNSVANYAVFGDQYPFDDGYYGYNGYGHDQLTGISTNTHDQYNNVLIFGIGIVLVMMMIFCVCAVLIGISMVSFAVGKYWDRCFKPTSKNNTVGNHNAFIENDLDQV